MFFKWVWNHLFLVDLGWFRVILMSLSIDSCSELWLELIWVFGFNFGRLNCVRRFFGFFWVVSYSSKSFTYSSNRRLVSLEWTKWLTRVRRGASYSSNQFGLLDLGNFWEFRDLFVNSDYLKKLVSFPRIVWRLFCNFPSLGD